jgi:hypothetical protein
MRAEWPSSKKKEEEEEESELAPHFKERRRKWEGPCSERRRKKKKKDKTKEKEKRGREFLKFFSNLQRSKPPISNLTLETWSTRVDLRFNRLFWGKLPNSYFWIFG